MWIIVPVLTTGIHYNDRDDGNNGENNRTNQYWYSINGWDPTTSTKVESKSKLRQLRKQEKKVYST